MLDYGGQYSQLIARRVRELGVFSELLPHHVGAEEVRKRKPKGLILSGGPASVYAPGAPRLDQELLELGIPVLGICYGMQLIALALGGRVEGAEIGEFGRSELTVREPGRLFAGLPEQQTCWMSHRDTVYTRAAGLHRARVVDRRRRSRRSRTSSAASTASSFIPRSSTRPTARRSSSASSATSAAPTGSWSPESIVAEQIAAIRAQVGDGKRHLRAVAAASTRASPRCSCTARSATS